MSYLKIAEHYDNCFKQHGDSNLGVDWPNYEDTLTRHQVMYEIVKKDNPSLLDFGCGLGHFNEWLINNNKKVQYSGLDINEGFYNACKTKFPNLSFYNIDIFKDNNLPNFDYITINGVFTEKQKLTQSEMMEFFASAIIKLWDKCNEGIAFNLMSKHVDWERDDLFHVSLDELGWFLKNHLSRNFIIRNDYKLYEYTTYVYKK
jgi:cyclopropane fatty-acyl-phospholipid synthase-like methyltransferase